MANAQRQGRRDACGTEARPPAPSIPQTTRPWDRQALAWPLGSSARACSIRVSPKTKGKIGDPRGAAPVSPAVNGVELPEGGDSAHKVLGTSSLSSSPRRGGAVSRWLSAATPPETSVVSPPFWHPGRGAGRWGQREPTCPKPLPGFLKRRRRPAVRWYRCAQPPANVLHPSGMPKALVSFPLPRFRIRRARQVARSPGDEGTPPAALP